MQLTLSKTTDADNVINKTLTNSKTIAINLKRDTDIINPVLILLRVEGVDFNDYNYCEIVELQRYYFIRRVDILNDKMFSLYCECDYLETYKTDILNSSGKYKKKIGTGDYGAVELDLTGKNIEFVYGSNVELEAANNGILSVHRWK